MKSLHQYFFILALFFLNSVSVAQVVRINPDTILYNTIDTTNLHFYIYKPEQFDSNNKYPAIVFYHGGGWNTGSPKAFNRQCMYFASRGMITITVEYRIKTRHGTTPFDAAEDALTALQYIYTHADEFNIDKNMIAAGGGSAGGHLAAYCGFPENLIKHTKNITVPGALVLFNPVLDTGKSGFAHRRMDGRYQELSPIHNIGPGVPPTLIMVGTEDKVLPVKTAETYKAQMKEAGNQCETVYYEGEEHAFFSRKIKYFVETAYEADKFLSSLGYLKGEPNIYQQYKKILEKNK